MIDEKGSTWNKIKGGVKEGVGKVAGDRELKHEGRKDQAVGRIKEGGMTSEHEIRSELDRLEHKDRKDKLL
ncbi:MAG TPA: CsbD family protein [Candidatus Thermoplasmatota archaeon]|nr:CsbD family protein [Candidatus Thermoplasmatota archaeon]